MADLLDYVNWRGDLDFRLVPPNCVDALVFSTLAYLDFSDIVPDEPYGSVPLPEAAARLLACTDANQRCRVKNDLRLLELAARHPRFASCAIAFHRDIHIPQEATQFAAMTFLLSDGSAFLAFRGTDYSLTGWKEDFNMSFRDIIPAQALALEYTLAFARTNPMPLHLAGHSKGGNLAVYAAAKSGELIQRRIVGVHNNDGPGFREAMMADPGYQAMVPRIYTYVPQSSVIGMMLAHEEPFQVVKSRQIGGLMQHDPYSWEIMGGDFIRMEQTTAESRIIDRTLKQWLLGMSNEERSAFVDTVFELLYAGGTDDAKELLKPKNLRKILRHFRADEEAKRLISRELGNMLQALWRTQFPAGTVPVPTEYSDQE